MIVLGLDSLWREWWWWMRIEGCASSGEGHVRVWGYSQVGRTFKAQRVRSGGSET